MPAASSYPRHLEGHRENANATPALPIPQATEVDQGTVRLSSEFVLCRSLGRQPREGFQILLGGLVDDVVGQHRARRRLVPFEGFEIVAHELFVKTRLGPTD